MTDELKPVRCGCGGEADIHKDDGTFGQMPIYTVSCNTCGMRSGRRSTEAEAVIAWNRAMGSHTTACTTEDGVYTSGCTITNTSSPNEDFHPVRDCMVGKERMAKVDWINGEPFCPMCGDRLEWDE